MNFLHVPPLLPLSIGDNVKMFIRHQALQLFLILPEDERQKKHYTAFHAQVITIRLEHITNNAHSLYQANEQARPSGDVE